MPAIQTTRRLLSAYADTESWRRDHAETRSCLDIEEKLAWGIHVFRGLLDLEARAQTLALKAPTPDATRLLELMPLFYQLWTEASEYFLERTLSFAETGFEIDGLEEFRETVEEARCLLGNLALEDELRPIEDLIADEKPENPLPERYGA